MGRFIAAYRARLMNNSKLAGSTKARADDSVKTLIKTWPELPERDVRRLTPGDCQEWAAKALREGTGFVAPNARTTRKGMSPSSLNKCINALRSILEIARSQEMVYENPANAVPKAAKRQKRLDLPSPSHFQWHCGANRHRRQSLVNRCRRLGSGAHLLRGQTQGGDKPSMASPQFLQGPIDDSRKQIDFELSYRTPISAARRATG